MDNGKILCTEEETEVIKNLLKDGEPLPPNIGQFENGLYYQIEESINNTSDINFSQSNNTFLYVISFIIPLVGFIAGAIMLSDNRKKEIGKMCIVLALISSLICATLYFLVVSAAV